MRNLLWIVLVVIVCLVLPVQGVNAAGQNQDNETRDKEELASDDLLMAAAGGLIGAGIQQLYFQEKPKAESRLHPILMGAFLWNVIVITKEMEFDDGDDTMFWQDILVANAGYAIGVTIWHYTIGKSIRVKSRKPRRRHNYLQIGGKVTQIQLY